jgi:hypothetical protein
VLDPELGERPADHTVSRVRLQFWTDGTASVVTQVLVYNGKTLIRQFNGPWSDGDKDIELHLDNPVSFREVGLVFLLK